MLQLIKLDDLTLTVILQDFLIESLCSGRIFVKDTGRLIEFFGGGCVGSHDKMI